MKKFSALTFGGYYIFGLGLMLAMEHEGIAAMILIAIGSLALGFRHE